MIKGLWFIFIFSFSYNLQASTFVGNGGQVGDIELRVTIRQIEKTFDDYLRSSSEENFSVCECPPDYTEHTLCESIRNLSQSHRNLCEKFTLKQARQVREALELVSFEWIHDNLSVKEKRRTRAADAVTVKAENRIYLQQNRFLNLTPSKRMFLITHELYHLSKWNNDDINDEDQIEGLTGRELLNAAAAAMTFYSISYNIFQPEQKYLQISRPSKNHWVSWNLETNSLSSGRDSSFKQSLTGFGRIGYRYQFDSGIGLGFNYRKLQCEKTVLTSISTEESRSILSFGLSYRWFAFNDRDPILSLSRSHFIFQLFYENMKAVYKVYDRYTGETIEANSNALSFSTQYFVPLHHEFWIYGGAYIDNHKLSYERISLEYNKNNPGLMLGVSYAF